MKKILFTLLSLLALIAFASCGGGNGQPDPGETGTDILAVLTDEVLRVHCDASNADPGSTVQLVRPYFGQDTADALGGFTITVELATATASHQASQATDEAHINYVEAGETMLAITPIVAYGSLVTAPLFSTGSAPNDMVFGNDSLYIANSLDNTVVRYGLDGTALATANYNEYASPSYLGLGDTTLYVLTNGDNNLYAHNADDLAATGLTESLSSVLDGDEANAAFPGPGVPACGNAVLYIPLSMIYAFDALTEYTTSYVLQYTNSGALSKVDSLSGKNGICCVMNPATDDLLATSAGEIQFDEFWAPYATTDSYLDIIKSGADNQALNLGQIGAGRIAVAPGGSRAFIGNSLSGNLYSVDLEAETVLHGADDPIVLTEEFTYIADVAYTPDGKYILAASFNTDEVYVIDAATDEINPGPYPAPFDLALDPELMAGAANIEIDPTPRADGGYDAYVLYGVANAVAKIALF